MGTISVSAKTPKVKKIKFSNVSSKKTMYRGTKKKFTVKITPSKAKSRKLQWYSSNKKVATVSSKGTVTAKKNGTAYITARVKSQKSKKVRCKVTVKTKKVSKVSFSSSKAVLQQGKHYTRKPTVSPSYAYNKKVTYKSSNTKVATVNSSGKIYAKGQGTAKITATAVDGSKKKSSYPVRVIGKITNKLSTKFIAHRGLSSVAPENTIPAFKEAVKAGFWGVETDVRKTKDGKFILMHDKTFKAMCRVDKKVNELTLDEIMKKLTIKSGSNIKKYPNLKVATLKEYLELCRNNNVVPVMDINIEQYEDMDVDDMGKLHKEVSSIMGDMDYIYLCHEALTLRELNDILKIDRKPNIRLQHVVDHPNTGNISLYDREEIELDCNYKYLFNYTLQRFKERNIPVNVWTVDNEEKVWDFITQKVDYITTNKKFW